MTLVEVTYELQSPLSEEQLRQLGEFSNTYGLRRFRLDDSKKQLSFEFGGGLRPARSSTPRPKPQYAPRPFSRSMPAVSSVLKSTRSVAPVRRADWPNPFSEEYA